MNTLPQQNKKQILMNLFHAQTVKSIKQSVDMEVTWSENTNES